MATFLEKTDYDGDQFQMDFTDKLPTGVALDPTTPTIEFVNLDGSAATGTPTSANFVRGNSNKSWQFDLTGGTDGSLLVVRVKATRDDGYPIEGDGILAIRIDGVEAA